MPKILGTVLLATSLLSLPLCTADAQLAIPGPAATNPTQPTDLTVPLSTTDHPIGLTIGGGRLTLTQRIALARAFGVTCIRPGDISLDDPRTQADAEAFAAAGFKLILTVRNSGRAEPVVVPGAPPADLASYQKALSAVLDKLHPQLLVVENEETSTFCYSGTPEQYGQQLKAACAVAHAKGIKCTNGGMTSTVVGMLLWERYIQRGEEVKADEMLKQCVPAAQVAMIRGVQGRQWTDEMIKKAKTLLKAYKDAGVDYVNFHWYISYPAAMEEAVKLLQEETGLPVVTNELGQRDADPETVRQLLGKAVDLKLPYVVWSSVDRPDARGLQEPKGLLIRENGAAFRAFIQERFGRR